MHLRPRPWVVAVVAGLSLALTAITPPILVGGQAAPPATVSITGTRPSSTKHDRLCDGRLVPVTPAAVTLTRTAPLTESLVVPIEIGGSLAGSLEEAPSAVTFLPGFGTTSISLSPIGLGPGHLTVTLLDGPDHDLGTPASVDMVVGRPTGRPSGDCFREIALDPDLSTQVIDVGEVPERLGLYQFSASRPGFTQARGVLPPGITYSNDFWEGAATTPGTYRFAVSRCSGYGDEPLPRCEGTAAVTIIVRAIEVPGGPDGSVEPDRSAGPAVPVPAAARFTG